jgi:hypothetical protein
LETANQKSLRVDFQCQEEAKARSRMAAVVADRASGGLGLAPALGCNQGEQRDLIMICQRGKGSRRGDKQGGQLAEIGNDEDEPWKASKYSAARDSLRTFSGIDGILYRRSS